MKKDKEKTIKDSDKVVDKPVKLTYPPSEDIYSRAEEVKDIDPDDLTKIKSPVEKEDGMNEKSYDDELTGDDLDVPGSEADNESNDNGDEDEENNYYSLPDNK